MAGGGKGGIEKCIFGGSGVGGSLSGLLPEGGGFAMLAFLGKKICEGGAALINDLR